MILTGDALRVASSAALDPAPEPDEASVDVHVPRDVTVEPHGFKVVYATEELSMPGYVAATITGRSTHMRAGVTMPGGFVDPSFEGRFALEFFNHTDDEFVIEKGEAGGRLTFMRLREYDTFEPRFWNNVDVGPTKTCWEWTASFNGNGYGQIRYAGTMRPAHRVAFRLAYGAPPEHVLHKCDNRACVNPAHLYSGDNKDNIQDKMERGQQPSGEEIHASKLTEDDVSEMRSLYAETDVTQEELAREYDIAQSNVSRILSGERW